MSYLNDLAAYADNRAANGGNNESDWSDDKFRFFNMKIDGKRIGDNLFRMFLMPYTSSTTGNMEIFRWVYKHFQLPVGIDGDGRVVKVTRTCLAKMDNAEANGAHCPFCDVIKHAYSEHGNPKGNALRRTEATAQIYANCLPLAVLGKVPDPNEYPYLPHIVTLKKTNYDWIADFILRNDCAASPDLDPFNPFNALPLEINKKRTGTEVQNVKYEAAFNLKRMPFANSEEDLETLYEEIYDLYSIFKYPDKEGMYESYLAEAEYFATQAKSMLVGNKPSVGASPFRSPAPAPQAPVAAPVAAPAAAPTAAPQATAKPSSMPRAYAPAPVAAPAAPAAAQRAVPKAPSKAPAVVTSESESPF